MKNSFRPCANCPMPCKHARGQAPKNLTAIDREIKKEKLKREGCPYSQ